METLSGLIWRLALVVILLFLLAKSLGIFVAAALHVLPSLLLIGLVTVAFRIILGLFDG